MFLGQFNHQVPLISKELLEFYHSLKIQDKPRKISLKMNRDLSKALEKTVETGLLEGLCFKKLKAPFDGGIFLKRDQKPIRALTILGVYTGVYRFLPEELEDDNQSVYQITIIDEAISLTPTEQAQVVEQEFRSKKSNNFVFICDAEKKGSWTRFINHGGVHSNCAACIKLVEQVIDGQKMLCPTVIMYAEADIQPGEQLLSDYGSEYWENLKVNPGEVTPTTFMC